MDADIIKLLVQIGGFVAGGAAAIYSWVVSRDKATQTELKELHGEIEVSNDRITRLEKDIEHMPDKESVHRTEIAIAEMRGDISTMAESFKSIGRTTRRIEDYLIEKAK